MRAGPELSLVEDYLARANASGRALALGPLDIVEIDERKARDCALQNQRLRGALPEGGTCIALDERGKAQTSPQFAQSLARMRDEGCPHLTLLIGGADGLDGETRGCADRLLSFGPMVWPHMLVRVMLAEQLYRAVSILAGSPYHRA